MTNKIFGLLALAALAGAVSVPLSAQSLNLTATVPFEFTVGDSPMPAGDYRLLSSGTPRLVQVRNEDTNSSVLTVTGSAYSGERSAAGSPRLVFNRYGDQYVLSQIWDGTSAGRQLTKGRSERELARTASVERIEILAMLMPR
jgi:hypothetical protein